MPDAVQPGDVSAPEDRLRADRTVRIDAVVHGGRIEVSRVRRAAIEFVIFIVHRSKSGLVVIAVLITGSK